MVELEIVDILTWGAAIVESNSPAGRVACENDAIVVEGLLEQVVPAGATDVCTIRRDRSLMMIQTVGRAPPTGRYVRLSSPNLKLFDANV